jgi:hypothetical protein
MELKFYSVLERLNQVDQIIAREEEIRMSYTILANLSLETQEEMLDFKLKLTLLTWVERM